MQHILKGWLAALVLVGSCSPVPAMTIKGNPASCIPFAETIERLVEYRNRNNETTVWTWEQAEPYIRKSMVRARQAEGSWIKDDEDAAYVMRSLQLAYHSFGDPGSVAALYLKGCVSQ